MTALFYAYQYVLRVLPNIVMPEMMSRYNIESDTFGQFAGIYYIAYSAAHIPIGIWLDKKGPKYVVPICIFITVLGTLPLIASESWSMVYLGRILIGMGSSAAILGLLKVIHLGFPEGKFSRMLGVGAFIGLMGGIYGSQPVAKLITAYGYEKVIEYIIYSGIIFGAISFLVMPKAKGVKQSDELNFKKDFAQVWKQKNIFYIAIFAGFMVGPLEGFSDAWGSSFLQVVYNSDKETATFLTSVIFIGMAFGSSVVAYVGDKTRSYYSVVCLCAVGMAIIFVATLLKMFEAYNMMVFMFFMVGIFSGYQVLTVYLSTTFVKEGVVGLTVAIVNMIVMSFGYLFHSVIGETLNFTWDGTMENGVRAYNAQSYIYGISVIPICLVIGGIGFLWLKKVNKVK
jgi:MFS family permease